MKIPLPIQLVLAQPQKARYLKLRALRNTEGSKEVGYAEFDIITP